MKNITILLLLVFSFSFAAEGSGEKAPDFMLKDLKGRPYRLSKNPSKVKVINFWATWCVPCLAEMTELKKLYSEFNTKGVDFVAISVDDNKSSSKVPAYVRARKLPFTILLDADKSLYKKMHIANVPSLVVLNEQNEVVYKHSGFKAGDEVALKRVIEATLTSGQ